VSVYSTLRDKLSFSSKEFKGKNLGEVIKDLCSMKKGIRKILLEEYELVKNYFVLTLNSEIIDTSKLEKTKVKDGDIFHISPPVSIG